MAPRWRGSVANSWTVLDHTDPLESAVSSDPEYDYPKNVTTYAAFAGLVRWYRPYLTGMTGLIGWSITGTLLYLVTVALTPLMVEGILGQRKSDRAAVLRRGAEDDGRVFLDDVPRLEELAERLQRRLVLRTEQHAACFTVKPVNVEPIG